MDRWERRLQIAARAGLVDDAAPGERPDDRRDDASDPIGGLERDVAGMIHPDELPTVRTLLELAGTRPGLRIEVPLLVRDGDRWTNRDFLIFTEFMGPVLRLADATTRRRRRTDSGELTALDRPQVLTEIAAAIVRSGDVGVAVLLFDLDRFKFHNDAVGDEKGNEILRTVADRIAETVGRSFSASMGSDEFVVILEGVDGLEEARQVAERVRVAIAEPITTTRGEIVLTATGGVAVGGADATAEQLLRAADTAVFEGKDHGRDRAEVFDQHLEARTTRRVASTHALRRALDEGALEMHYQPIFSLETEMIVGAEALLRIHGDDDGHRVVRPARLIDAAEDVGLVDRIGRFVLDHTAAQIAEWERVLGPARRFRVSVNVSPVQLATPGFTGWVADALRDADVDPSRLSLELTESIFLDPDPDVDVAVSRLVELGVGFGLDDFGADRSSFGGVRRFPIEFVKLDRDVVAEIDRDETDEVIAESAVNLARQLGFTTVAVGVERVSQRDVLRKIGCDAVQGYLFDAPMPPEELAARL